MVVINRIIKLIVSIWGKKPGKKREVIKENAFFEPIPIGLSGVQQQPKFERVTPLKKEFISEKGETLIENIPLGQTGKAWESGFYRITPVKKID